MGCDIPEEHGGAPKVGDNITISINPSSEEEARTIFDSLSAGGTVKVPLDKMFWGALFGMFVDKYGINWMVNYEFEQI